MVSQVISLFCVYVKNIPIIFIMKIIMLRLWTSLSVKIFNKALKKYLLLIVGEKSADKNHSTEDNENVLLWDSSCLQLSFISICFHSPDCCLLCQTQTSNGLSILKLSSLISPVELTVCVIYFSHCDKYAFLSCLRTQVLLNEPEIHSS